MISFDLYQTLALAVLALWMGAYVKKKIPFLEHICIPAPVVGGVLFALFSLLGYSCHWFECQFDETMKNICMVFFFTSVGFQASIKALRRGGMPLLYLVGAVVVLMILQNGLSVGIARMMGMSGLVGMTAGSVSMVGGHGTSVAFGPLIEQLGLKGATTLATAAATFGLVAGSLIGGPIAERLIEKKHLLNGYKSTENKPNEFSFSQKMLQPPDSYMNAAFLLIVAIGLGTLFNYLLSLTGASFPVYIGPMIAAAIMRNVLDHKESLSVPMPQINELGAICLSLFLGIAMTTLRLWELADLALPLIVMLVGQTVLMALYARYAVFPLMGGNYDAAVITAGLCGFGMGATPNAMANMQAVCDKYVPSVQAYLLIPIVGTMFADFINSLTITCFLNLI